MKIDIHEMQSAIDQAGNAVFAARNVMRPLFESSALRDVLAERLKQVEKYDYDPEHDRTQPLEVLPDLVSQYAITAMNRAQRGPGRHLPGARKKLVQVAALALAAIDRIDAEPSALVEQAHADEPRLALP
jgi:hypothetical protein